MGSQLSPPHETNKKLQEALLSQRGRAMLRVCIASIPNVERSLLLLVPSVSDIPLRTIKFFFSSLLRIHPCCRLSHTNIQWCVADCAIYTAWSSVTKLSLRSSHVQQLIDSQWCMADCVIYSASSSVNVFGTSHVQQSSIASY